MHVFIRSWSTRFFLIELLDSGDENLILGPPWLATGEPTAPDVALPIDQKFQMRRERREQGPS